MQVTIYGLFDPAAPDAIRYVGKSTHAEKRLGAHLRSRGVNAHRENWIASVRAAGRTPAFVVLDTAATDAEANELERQHIARLRAAGADLTNKTDGGDGQPKGWNPPEHWRAAHRGRLKGRKRNREVVDRIARALQGHSVSPETRAKIGAANTGRRHPPRSEEYRAKLSAAASCPHPWTAERNRQPWTPERRANQRAAQRRRWARARGEASA